MKKQEGSISDRNRRAGNPERRIKRSAPAAAVVLLCALCILPPVMAFTYTFGDSIWTLDEAGEEWWMLNSSHPYCDRWYFWIENIGVFLILLAILFLYQENQKRLGTGKPLSACLPAFFPVVCLAFVLVWAALSTLLSGNPERCIWGTGYRHDGLFSYLIYGAVLLVSLFLAVKSDSFVRILLECLTGVGVFSALLIAFQTDCRWLELLGNLEINTGFFANNNHQGYFNTMCWASAVTLFFCDQKPWKKGLKKRQRLLTSLLFVFRLAELWLMTNSVVFCSVRGSFVAVCTVLAALHVLLFRRRQIYPELLAVDAVFLLTNLGLNTGGTLNSRMSLLVAQLTDLQNNSDSIGSGRGILWKYGIQFALEKPVFGYGPDNLGEAYHALGIDVDRPHNEYIQIAAMLGFPALFAYLAGIGRHYYLCWKERGRLPLLCMGCTCIAGGYLVSAAFGNTMFYTTPYFYMCLGFSIGLFLKNSRKNRAFSD